VQKYNRRIQSQRTFESWLYKALLKFSSGSVVRLCDAERDTRCIVLVVTVGCGLHLKGWQKLYIYINALNEKIKIAICEAPLKIEVKTETFKIEIAICETPLKIEIKKIEIKIEKLWAHQTSFKIEI
jgi:hypothetical protein